LKGFYIIKTLPWGSMTSLESLTGGPVSSIYWDVGKGPGVFSVVNCGAFWGRKQANEGGIRVYKSQ